jgi:hypothetical protein
MNPPSDTARNIRALLASGQAVRRVIANARGVVVPLDSAARAWQEGTECSDLTRESVRMLLYAQEEDIKR